MYVGNLQVEKSAAGGDPSFRVVDAGVDAVMVQVRGDGCAVVEGCRENGRWIAVPVKRSLEVEVQMGDAWGDAAVEVPQFQALRGRDEACAIAIDNGCDEMECFNDGALACVVLPDHHRTGMKRDDVVTKATVVLQAQGSQHLSSSNGSAQRPEAVSCILNCRCVTVSIWRAYARLLFVAHLLGVKVEPLRIGHLAIVETITLFVQIPEQVERFHANVCAVQHSFGETPEVLTTVRVKLMEYIIRNPLTNVNVDFRDPVTYHWSMPKKKMPDEVREYFVKMGRQGGLIGGKIRAEKLTAEQRSESARSAVNARWKKKYDTQ
jgi:hypothetical protein